MTSAIEIVGGSSSSVIVKIAESSKKEELVALERVIFTVSLFSSSESESTGILKAVSYTHLRAHET